MCLFGVNCNKWAVHTQGHSNRSLSFAPIRQACHQRASLNALAEEGTAVLHGEEGGSQPSFLVELNCSRM